MTKGHKEHHLTHYQRTKSILRFLQFPLIAFTWVYLLFFFIHQAADPLTLELNRINLFLYNRTTKRWCEDNVSIQLNVDLLPLDMWETNVYEHIRKKCSRQMYQSHFKLFVETHIRHDMRRISIRYEFLPPPDLSTLWSVDDVA